MKKIFARKSSFIFLAVGIIILLVMIAVIFLIPKTAGQAAPKSTKVVAMSKDSTTDVVMGSLVGYTVEEMMARSTLIVTGTVEDVLPAQRTISASNGATTVTDVTFRVNEILRGEAEEVITIRLSGGVFNGEATIYTEEPELTTQTEYLFFLYQPHMGGEYVEGDFYYIVGVNQGSYQQVEDSQLDQGARAQLVQGDVLFANSKTMESNTAPLRLEAPEGYGAKAVLTGEQVENLAGLEPGSAIFSLNALQDGMASFNERNPIDTGLFRREIEEGLEWNRETGFITQEEYDQIMAELDIYATYAMEGEADASESKPELITTE